MMRTKHRSWIHLLFALVLTTALGAGCGGCDPESGSGNNGSENGMNSDGGNLDAATGDAQNGGSDATGGTDATGGSDVGPQIDSDSPFELTDAGMVSCGDGPCACDDGIDNDGDGLTDGFDPECTGPYDDDESTFATGIPGDNKDPIWQDCFFDGNSGSGDDKCRYKTGCLTGELDSTHRDCQVGQDCFDFCRPLTPNGCDCFGCCEVYDDMGDPHYVLIGGTCSVDKLGTAECTTCTQSESCLNECGECELCLGKTIDDLPDSCFDDPTGGDAGTDGGTSDGGTTGGPTCDDGETPCESSLDCPTNGYCQLGCCIEVVL